MPNTTLARGVDQLPSGRFRARFRNGAGRHEARTFTTANEAAAWLLSARDGLPSPDGSPHIERIKEATTPTLAKYASTWAEAQPHRPTTRRRCLTHRTHLLGHYIGKRPLSDLRPTDIQHFVADRSRVLAPSTVRTLVHYLRAVLNGAVADGLIPSNPAKGVKLPRSERRKLEPLTVQQVAALASAMPRRNRAMVIVQAGLGLRIGELLALKVEDFDTNARVVRIRRQLAPGAKGFSAPKTPSSVRDVPLPEHVARAVQEHLATFPANHEGVVFTTRFDGCYRHDEYGTTIFREAVARAGLPAGTTSHDLRHHYCSTLLARGVPVNAVAAAVGHEDGGALLLRTYSHLYGDSGDATRRVLDAAWSDQSEA